MNLTKCLFVTVYLLFSIVFAHAQQHELSEPPKASNQTNHNENKETDTVLQAFTQGKVSGHFRYFFMTTDNKLPLTDYFAHAAGVGLKFETAPFHHLQAGIGATTVFNLNSSSFTVADKLSNQYNRYEIALFDIENPDKKSNLMRLDEFYLKYHLKNLKLTYGRQLINTPFINQQDGRMMLTAVQGIWASFNNKKKWKIEGGYLYRISPRSTFSFYDMGKSIGIYPSGVDVDGTKSNYKNNLNSKGILTAGITNTHLKGITIQLWNQFVENIFNTTMIQADYHTDDQKKSQIIVGLQSVFQTAVHQDVHDGINEDYYPAKMRSFTYGAKLGWNIKKVETSLNYNRITAMGRYLMPREWGREPFYTFLPRERNEGLGDVHALTLKIYYALPSLRIKVNAGAGYYNLPPVRKFKLNKYGMPSYSQFNLDIKYEFAGMLKGFEAQLLVAHKMNASKEAIEYKNIINKVDMTNISAAVNFRF